MKEKKKYPDWVEKYHTKGTSIKKIRDNYYLYRVTSYYSDKKPYPVAVQTYIGKIDETKGLIKPRNISFTPGKDSLLLFKDVFSLDLYDEEERKILGNIPVIYTDGICCSGKLDNKVITLIRKHYSYNEGVIS